jgi:hypothetical protein
LQLRSELKIGKVVVDEMTSDGKVHRKKAGSREYTDQENIKEIDQDKVEIQ